MESRGPFRGHLKLASLTGYEVGHSQQLGGIYLHLETHEELGYPRQTLEAFLTPAQATELALQLQKVVREYESGRSR